MNDSKPDDFRDTLWRRPLSKDEQARLDAWLDAHPDARDEWADEATLTRLLAKLPDAPVASNFTARVLAQIESDERQPARRGQGVSGWRWVSGWLPRAAMGVAAFGLAVFGWQHHVQTERAELVRTVAQSVPALPPPEVLVDMDAVSRLDTLGASPDLALLSLIEE